MLISRHPDGRSSVSYWKQVVNFPRRMNLSPGAFDDSAGGNDPTMKRAPKTQHYITEAQVDLEHKLFSSFFHAVSMGFMPSRPVHLPVKSDC